MSKAGRLPELQVDQAKQNELGARNSWILSIEAYENALDQYKLTLGLPADVSLEMDANDLETLRKQGILPLTVSLDDAVRTALASRLDVKTVGDRLADRQRKVEVAENALQADLDLSLNYQRDTGNSNSPLDFAEGNDTYGVGLDLGLPLDRKSERNAYRRALIGLEAAKRDVRQTEDNVKLDVRDAFRQIKQVEKSYEIQVSSLELAQRRAESTKILQEAGRAITRDVLEAEEALLEAQNAVTSALVDNFGARLDLYLATETLKIDDQGLWSDEGETHETE
jgi:outer membrane protein TolC